MYYASFGQQKDIYNPTKACEKVQKSREKNDFVEILQHRGYLSQSKQTKTKAKQKWQNSISLVASSVHTYHGMSQQDEHTFMSVSCLIGGSFKLMTVRHNKGCIFRYVSMDVYTLY